MTFNYSPASSLYHGINPIDTVEEKSSLDEIIAATRQNDPNVVEGRITYASPLKEFYYKDNRKGWVQNYVLTDILGKQSKNAIYTYRITAWNDQALNGVLKIDNYYRLSQFAWKENNYQGNIPDHQSKYKIDLKPSSIVEPVAGQILMFQ